MTINRLALASMSLAMGLGLTGCNQSPTPPSPPPQAPKPPIRFTAHDSPVTVEGGSIHSQLSNQQSWTKVSNKHYTTTTTNYNQLFSDGITWDTSLPASADTWTINISSTNNQKAVVINSDAACSPSSPAAPCIIHLQTEPNSRWHVNKANQLRYHDNKCDGASGNGEDSDCDFFQSVSITYTGSTSGTSNGTCNDNEYGPGYCMIGIGKK